MGNAALTKTMITGKVNRKHLWTGVVFSRPFVCEMSKREQHPFVQERLEKLHEIDSKLVSILNHSSSGLTDIANLKKNASDQGLLEKTKEEFTKDIKSFLSDLEWASVNLKREIKALDDRIGKTDSNGITILPININKKATWSGEEKLNDQLNTLNKLIKNESTKTSDSAIDIESQI